MINKLFTPPPAPDSAPNNTGGNADEAVSERAIKADLATRERARRRAARLRRNLAYLALLALALVIPASIPVFDKAPLREPAAKMVPQNSMEPPVYDNIPAEPAEGRDLHSGRARH